MFHCNSHLSELVNLVKQKLDFNSAGMKISIFHKKNPVLHLTMHIVTKMQVN